MNPNPPFAPNFGIGGMSILDIDSWWIDPDTGLWVKEGLFDRLSVRYDFKAISLNIPDLFADTNGDGVIGDGDVLYSFVNIYQFTVNAPVFSLGDWFTIVNGQVPGLEGMWFSPTPIYVDPVLGPQPSGGAWYNSGQFQSWSTGNAVAMSAHSLYVPHIPEPATWAMMIAGFGIVGLGLRRHGRLPASLS